MKKILLFTSLAVIGILFSTCDRKEEDKQPVACFSPSSSNTTVGTTIAFNNCSTDAQIYSWNFGDGTATSSEVSPSHSFASAGQFTVTLKAWYKNNVDEETQIITVTGGNVVACFTFNPSSAVTNETVAFTNCSEGASSYKWDFQSDGVIERTDENPSVYFTDAGTYDVKLTAVSASGAENSVTHSIVISPGAGFDPKVYKIDSYVSWSTVYYNDFTSSGDFYEGTDTDCSGVISGGVLYFYK